MARRRVAAGSLADLEADAAAGAAGGPGGPGGPGSVPEQRCDIKSGKTETGATETQARARERHSDEIVQFECFNCFEESEREAWSQICVFNGFGREVWRAKGVCFSRTKTARTRSN